MDATAQLLADAGKSGIYHLNRDPRELAKVAAQAGLVDPGQLSIG